MRQAFSKRLGQTGGANLLLRLEDVVFHAAQLDEITHEVKDHVSRFRVAVAWLADGSDVDEIFLPNLDLDLRVQPALNSGLTAHERDRHVSVAIETYRRVL